MRVYVDRVSKSKILAKVVRESTESVYHDLEVGKIYEVESIEMGGFYTDVYLKDLIGSGDDISYNSVIFKFYEDNEELDIYRDKRFNQYS